MPIAPDFASWVAPVGLRWALIETAGAFGEPLAFDANFSHKPAADAMVQVLSGR